MESSLNKFPHSSLLCPLLSNSLNCSTKGDGLMSEVRTTNCGCKKKSETPVILRKSIDNRFWQGKCWGCGKMIAIKGEVRS